MIAETGTQVAGGSFRPGGERSVFVLDAREGRLALCCEIDLVDGDDELPDAQQREEHQIAPDHRREALAGVDHDDAEIGGRCGGQDAAGIALLTGDVIDDEGALVRLRCRVRGVRESRAARVLLPLPVPPQR